LKTAPEVTSILFCPVWRDHFNQGHHQSNHPTPWTSFAFDPLEEIAQLLFLVGIVFVLPLHFITVIELLSAMTVWTIVNHLNTIRSLPMALTEINTDDLTTLKQFRVDRLRRFFVSSLPRCLIRVEAFPSLKLSEV
jgi:Fatty acid hydroxylase superfamily